MHSFFFFGGNRVCVKNDKCYFAVLEMKGDGWNRAINISVVIYKPECIYVMCPVLKFVNHTLSIKVKWVREKLINSRIQDL